MKLDVMGLITACSYALDCVEAELAKVTNNHSKRVAYMAVCVAEQMKISGECLQDLAECAMLHDNALTQYIHEELHNDLKQNEYKKLGIHCSLGEKNIRNLPFHSDVTNVILYHHENADGTGPFGKKWNEVPLFARIIHMCDIVDVYTFCSYLLRLLPADPSVMIDLDGMLKLEFYKLEETFKGNIQLIDASGEYDPASAKGKGVPEKKEPLEEVIDKINEMFNGNFTDADRVVLTVLHDKLKADKKLLKIAKTSDPQIFAESIFPKTFDDVAQESYIEQTEAFSSMFQNKSKYKAMMAALAEILYKEFNK